MKLGALGFCAAPGPPLPEEVGVSDMSNTVFNYRRAGDVRRHDVSRAVIQRRFRPATDETNLQSSRIVFLARDDQNLIEARERRQPATRQERLGPYA